MTDAEKIKALEAELLQIKTTREQIRAETIRELDTTYNSYCEKKVSAAIDWIERKLRESEKECLDLQIRLEAAQKLITFSKEDI